MKNIILLAIILIIVPVFIILFLNSYNLLSINNLQIAPRESASQEEYTITFRTDLPVNNLEETKTYTSNKDCPLPKPRTYGYTFSGWEDEDHRLIKNNKISKNTVERDIILTAKWISNRNKYYSEPVKQIDIIEDEKNSKFYYVYKVGRIERVPLKTTTELKYKNPGESLEHTTTKDLEFTTEEAKTISKEIQRKSINSESITLAKTIAQSSSSSKSKTETKTPKKEDNGIIEKLLTDTVSFINPTAGNIVKKSIPYLKPIIAKYSKNENKKNVNEVTGESKIMDTISNAIETKESNSSNESKTNSKNIVSTNEYGTKETTNATMRYTERMKISQSESQKITITQSGYYREVVASTIHIYKIVGYNLKTKELFTFDHYSIDNNIYTASDYSFDSSSCDDRESEYDASFAIPEEVFTHISNKICETEGLSFSADGAVEEYTGKSDTVLIPEYSCIAGEDEEDGDVIKVTSIEPGVFKDNKTIKRVILSDFITEIPDNTFDGCKSLEYVWGENISKIGNNAFRGCKSLKEIAGNNINIIEIGNSAFSGCQSLEKFMISSKVESIGQEAFKDIQEITAEAANAKIIKAIFCSGAKNVVIYTYSLNKKSLSGTKIDIPESIESFSFIDKKSDEPKEFQNLTIESHAQVSNFENIAIRNNISCPLLLYSKEVKFHNINIESKNIAVIFYNDVKLNLVGNSKINSNNEYAILSKGINPYTARNSRQGFLGTKQKIAICDNQKNRENLDTYFKAERMSKNAPSATIVSISEQDFNTNLPEKSLVEKSNFDSNSDSYINSKEYTVDNSSKKLTSSQESISDWTNVYYVPNDATIVEESWTYDEIEYRTSSESYLPGWERYDVEYRWGDFGRWSDWQSYPVSNSDTRQVDTRYIEPKYNIQYNYSR